MKKIISLLLSFILVISMISVVFADEKSDTLSAVGVLPAFSKGDTSPVTRAEFAYMTARLIGAEKAPMSTSFGDVGESNMYSGYIEYLASIGVVSGYGDGNFGPEGNVTFGQAAKMIVNILGYDSFGGVYGGYPDGYVEVLSILGISKGVSLAADSILTVENAIKLVYNALTLEINGLEYSDLNGDLEAIMTSEKKDSVLASVFGISVYYGTVESTNNAGTFVDVLISGNKYDCNPIILNKGQKVNLEVGDGISAESYINVPSIIFVDENEKIVKIAPQKDVEVKFAIISKINGTDKNFPISNINTMMFLDDETEYDVADDAILNYNGYRSYDSEYLNGKFAKVVLKDNEVVFVESWDLVDGGLITNSDGNTLTYIKNGKTLYLRDLASEKKIVTIIGENGAKVTEIKADSTFMYYRRDGYVALIVSEKKIVDTFTSISANSVEIGEVSYAKKKVAYTEAGPEKKDNLLYFTEDGENFNNSDYITLLERNVAAYIGPDGYVWYVKAMTADSAVRKFYGLVKGAEVDNMDEEFGEIKVIEIADTFSESTYAITDKTVYNDGLSLVEIATDAKEKSLSGEGIYEFEVSASGKLVSVSEPDPIYGYTSTSSTVASFGTVAVAKLAPHYIYWNSGQKMLVIYEKNGELALAWTTWTALYEQTASLSLNIHIFGKGKDITPSLIVLTSGATPISELGSQERYGIITNITNVLGEDGETKKELSVIMKSGNKKYVVDPDVLKYTATDDSGKEVTKTITKNTIIKFREDVRYGDNDILLIDKYVKPLGDNFENWPAESGWSLGVADGADASRVLINNFGGMENGSLFFHITMNFIAVYNADAPVNQFTLGSWSDIDEGDYILYNNIGDGTRGVIIIK